LIQLSIAIEQAWDSAYNNMADVKELIPEFYSPDSPGFLVNQNNLDLGIRFVPSRVTFV
jgi:hypothetical protein